MLYVVVVEETPLISGVREIVALRIGSVLGPLEPD
jgi:hypothetical protein